MHNYHRNHQHHLDSLVPLLLPHGLPQLHKNTCNLYRYAGEGASAAEEKTVQALRQNKEVWAALKLDRLTSLTHTVRTSKNSTSARVAAYTCTWPLIL